jgi:hypothetical protein
MFGMMDVFAEFERSMIQERVRVGLARAKAAAFGRPSCLKQLTSVNIVWASPPLRGAIVLNRGGLS